MCLGFECYYCLLWGVRWTFTNSVQNHFNCTYCHMEWLLCRSTYITLVAGNRMNKWIRWSGLPVKGDSKPLRIFLFSFSHWCCVDASIEKVGLQIEAPSRSNSPSPAVCEPRRVVIAPNLPKPLSLEEKKFLLAVERGDQGNVRR